MPQWDSESSMIEHLRLSQKMPVTYEGRVQIRRQVINTLRDILQTRIYSDRDQIASCLRVLQEYQLYAEYEEKKMEGAPVRSWHSARMAVDGNDE
jgi:hypothetical protein